MRTLLPPLRNRGVLLPTLLIILLFILSIGITMAGLAISRLQDTHQNIVTSNSLFAAEAGVERTLHELNNDDNFAGFETEQEFFNNQEQGRGTFETTIENGDIDDEKILTATGRVYRPADATEPSATRQVQLTVVGTTITDERAVHAGAGGLILNGSATVANGPVHVNGYIEMNGASRIGSSSTPIDVSVSNIRCPAAPAEPQFPRLCEENQEGDPIDMAPSARIYGDVCATHQQDGGNMSDGGLTAGCVADELTMPPYDREGQIEAVETQYSTNQASCTGNQSVTWPANLHVTGDVSTGGSCDLTISGDAWVDGNFSTGGASTIYIDDSLDEPPVIMVDGSSGVHIGASTQIVPNPDGIAPLIITYYSADSCSPDCEEVTGGALWNSKDHVTVRISGSAEAPATLFYSRWTKTIVEGSGTTGGTIGQTVELNGAGNIVFGTELSSGESVWSIKNYRRIFETTH